MRENPSRLFEISSARCSFSFSLLAKSIFLVPAPHFLLGLFYRLLRPALGFPFPRFLFIGRPRRSAGDAIIVKVIVANAAG